ncbi:MAG: DUF2442 domain-containing protein [Bacteroidales bacterium]|nr:DUF2442 domain-containing protein [Bacteroidales bacterium]
MQIKNQKDPIDVLIFEKGLRIKNLIIDNDLDLLAVVLNNGKILESKISDYPRLANASDAQLKKWELISHGIGVTWEELDEDLSVKGFIKTAAINEMLEHLQYPLDQKQASA